MIITNTTSLGTPSKREKVKMKYTHKETGSIDNRGGWESSYHTEELESRDLTASKAFDEDVEDGMLAEVDPSSWAY